MRVVPELPGHPELVPSHAAAADGGVKRLAHRYLIAVDGRAIEVTNPRSQRRANGARDRPWWHLVGTEPEPRHGVPAAQQHTERTRARTAARRHSHDLRATPVRSRISRGCLIIAATTAATTAVPAASQAVGWRAAVEKHARGAVGVEGAKGLWKPLQCSDGRCHLLEGLRGGGRVAVAVEIFAVDVGVRARVRLVVAMVGAPENVKGDAETDL